MVHVLTSFAVTGDDCSVSSNMMVLPETGTSVGASAMGSLLNMSVSWACLPSSSVQVSGVTVLVIELVQNIVIITAQCKVPSCTFEL